MNPYVIKSLEKAIQQVLSLHPEYLNDIKKHEGKLLELHFKKPSFDLILHIEQDQLHIYSHTPKEINARIKTTPWALMRMLNPSQRSFFVSNASFEIEGDVDFCQDLFHVLKNIDLDWVEYLSHFTNDTIATVVEQAFDKIKHFSLNTFEQVRADSEEYLKYETTLLPNPQDVTCFLDEVDRLVDDVARVEARIKRLEQMI